MLYSRQFLWLFVVIAFPALTYGQDDGFSLKAKNAVVKAPVKPKAGTAKEGSGESKKEIAFLTLSVEMDLNGTLYIGDNQGKPILAGQAITMPVYRANENIYFVGADQNGFTFKDDLKFTPDQKGTHQSKIYRLAEKYDLFLDKKAQQSVDELVIAGITSSMVPIYPDAEVLPKFEMSRFEVSVGEFELFMRRAGKTQEHVDSAFIVILPSGVRRFRPGIDWRHDAIGYKRAVEEYDHPVINVSWNEASAFCEWLTSIDEDYLYRLPTAAEWEYVASCGGYFQYPWGDDLAISSADDLPANTADESLKARVPKLQDRVSQIQDGYAFTSPRGKFQANCMGLYDLGGNVAEWLEDDVIKETTAKKVKEHKVKGGSYFTTPGSCLVKTNYSKPPYLKHCGIGFRIVRVPKS